MKVIGLKQTNLDDCVDEAQHENVIVTRNGKPVALVVGVAGLDAEQVELGSSPDFWKLITSRRGERTITRAQVEERIPLASKAKPRAAEQGVAPAAVARKKRSRRRG
jgi:prevent-host-death family protein